MKKDKNQSSFTAIGSSSLLVVFLVLCLATFAILSLSSAKSDHSFTERLSAHKSRYYEACSQAETILGNIDRLLEQTYRSGTMSQEEYLDALTLALMTASETPCSYSTESGEPIISYNVPVDEKQTLFVELKVTDPSQSPNYYEIQSWHVAPSGTWENDGSLDLMPVQQP
ncbi:MAG: hypothetical protein HFG99_09935 [Dorea sp.]|jgi:hypothetical protein|nr:hypothetical protein [Dorea sp.]MCI9249448.1 hypothetical protein [Dorea sp.]